MSKPKPLIWSDEALEAVYSIYEYIETNFGDSPASDYLIKVYETEQQIIQDPLRYPRLADKPNMRYAIVDGLTIIHYEVNEDAIHINKAYDARQDRPR